MSQTKSVPTYCRICEPQCALVAEVLVPSPGETEKIIKLRPDSNHPIHKGFACHKGLNFVELHNDPDRLNYPQVRTNAKSSHEPKFETVSWDTAIQSVAERINTLQQQHGSDALGFYIGNPSAFNSTGREAARKFATSLGAKYMFGSGTQDCTNKFAASEGIFGTANLHPLPDYKHTQYLLSIGSNPKISHASFVHMSDPMGALRNIVSRGGKVVHINPRNIESATKKTGNAVQIKPDTDVYLLAALLHSIHRQGLHDQAWIEKHAHNVDALWDFVQDYPAALVADVVGISASEIETIATEFAQAQGASIHMSTGANMGRQGTFAYWLVQMMSLVTGNLGRRGGNIYSPGYFAAATVGKPKQADPFFDSEFGEMRRIAGSLPGNLLADHIEAGLVKGLVCMSGNPVLSMAGESRLKDAFAKLEFMLVVDIYPNATSLYADYLLPATDWLERPDINSVSLGLQPEPYVQYTPAVVSPQFERRPEWQIFAGIQQALGLPNLLDDPASDPMARTIRQLAACGINLEQLTSSTSNTICLEEPDPDQLFGIGVQLKDARADCMPAIIVKGIPTCTEIFQQLQDEDEHTYKLITLRTNYMVNSWLHNLPALKRKQALDNPLHLHPQDLQQLALSEGEEVEVSSAHGRIIAKVVEDKDLRPGVVAMTHGWGHANNPRLSLASNHPGTNVNTLLPSGAGSYDPLSNMSFMTGITVNITATA